MSADSLNNTATQFASLARHGHYRWATRRRAQGTGPQQLNRHTAWQAAMGAGMRLSAAQIGKPDCTLNKATNELHRATL
jgi:hypothetical protein